MDLHGAQGAIVEHRWESAGRQRPQRPASASALGRACRPASASAGGRALRKAASVGEPRFNEGSNDTFYDNEGLAAAPAPARRLQRPASAPLGRHLGGGKQQPPQVNLNKVAPLGTAPRWTIRSKPSDTLFASRTPGPGSYDLASPDAYWCKKKPAFSMAKKDTRHGSVRPGPADYSFKSGPRGPKWKIGEHTKGEDRRPNTPGPGAYDPPDGRSRMKKTIAASVAPPDSRAAYPGRGTYEAADQFRDFTRQMLPKHRFPNAERTWEMRDGPGPGDYDPADYVFSRRPPSYTIRKKCEEKVEEGPDTFTTYSQFV